MNKSLPERRPFLLLVFLLSLLLVLMSHGVRTGTGRTLLEQNLFNLISPVVKGSSRVLSLGSGLWTSYVDLRGAHRESLEARRQLGRVEEQARSSEEYRRENLRLRELLDLKRLEEVPSLAAEVLAVTETGQARTALIGRGSRDGVRRDLPVINRQGVVGRVLTVGSGSSKVQLLIDPNSGVAGLLQRTRGQGMVVGAGDAGCRMEYVSELENVEVGDVVVTSGLDRIYPKGIRIGMVSSVEEGDQLTKNIGLKPEVDFRRLEEVLVLLVPDEARTGEESP
jgi:rod shape-determining protein MreC